MHCVENIKVIYLTSLLKCYLCSNVNLTSTFTIWLIWQFTSVLKFTFASFLQRFSKIIEQSVQAWTELRITIFYFCLPYQYYSASSNKSGVAGKVLKSTLFFEKKQNLKSKLKWRFWTTFYSVMLKSLFL